MKNINDFDKLIYSIIGTALFFGLVVYASYEDSGKGYDSIGFILPIIIVILSFIALFGFEIYKRSGADTFNISAVRSNVEINF